MNKIQKKDKKGAEIISVYWFVILLLVAAGVSYMVFSFYGKPYDVREIEAGLLADKTADCVSYAGYLREGILHSNFQENFLGKCGLNLEVEDAYRWKEQGQYFLKIEFYDFNQNSLLLEASAGNINLKNFCNLEGKNFPFCLEREFFSLDKQGNLYTIKIISIIGKTEKNA